MFPDYLCFFLQAKGDRRCFQCILFTCWWGCCIILQCWWAQDPWLQSTWWEWPRNTHHSASYCLCFTLQGWIACCICALGQDPGMHYLEGFQKIQTFTCMMEVMLFENTWGCNWGRQPCHHHTPKVRSRILVVGLLRITVHVLLGTWDYLVPAIFLKPM